MTLARTIWRTTRIRPLPGDAGPRCQICAFYHGTHCNYRLWPDWTSLGDRVFAPGRSVKLYDNAPGAGEKALGLIQGSLDELHEFGLITAPPATILRRISIVGSLRDA